MLSGSTFTIALFALLLALLCNSQQTSAATGKCRKNIDRSTSEYQQCEGEFTYCGMMYLETPIGKLCYSIGCVNKGGEAQTPNPEGIASLDGLAKFPINVHNCNDTTSALGKPDKPCNDFETSANTCLQYPIVRLIETPGTTGGNRSNPLLGVYLGVAGGVVALFSFAWVIFWFRKHQAEKHPESYEEWMMHLNTTGQNSKVPTPLNSGGLKGTVQKQQPQLMVSTQFRV